MPRNLLYVFLICASIFSQELSAQDSVHIPSIDISAVQNEKLISGVSETVMVPRNLDIRDNLGSLRFKKGLVYRKTIPSKDVTRKLILKFRVCNLSDTVSTVWFFPGFYYTDVILYAESGNTLNLIPPVYAPIEDNIGFREIRLEPHDSATIYAELFQLKTYINSIRPRLIQNERINFFLGEVRTVHNQNDMATFVFCGLLLMMILFSLTTFFQQGNKEFLYYALYAFFLGAMLFTKATNDFEPNHFSFFLEAYLDFILQCTGHAFYMIFMQRFLSSKKCYPFLHKLYNFGVVMLAAAIVIYSFLHFFTDNYTLEYWTENATKLILLGMTIIFLIYGGMNWKSRIIRYLFWGNLMLFIFSLLSLVSVMTDRWFLRGIFGSALLYYEIGLFLELVFFLAGLNYKNRRQIIKQTRERERLKSENQLKEYEKAIAVYKAQQEERQRISADMHDELGAGMTAIRLMSEIARNKMKESTPIEIEKISHSADEVLNKMNAIIWSMNSGNDTLDNLVSYIRSYALEYFESTNVDCKVKMPENIEALEITGDKRRNIFLCVKETLNNALKHSKAKEIVITFEIAESLRIVIQDDGVGIDMQKLRQFGNGLKNITRRMESIGGTYEIMNDQGTKTILTLPL